MQHFLLDFAKRQIVRDADVQIDSGAFGKGEGLDRVLDHATRQGADPWLIDLGGQVMVYGRPPGRSGWKIDVAHPDERDRAVFTVELTSGSLSTSSNSEQPGHILDPRTGTPVEFNGSVVVWHERGLVADILSTALFVMGPEKGLDWANARGFAACFLVRDGKNLRIRTTTAFANQFNIDEVNSGS
jgi:thiamine biosynthesis lipoprotein